VTAGRPTKSTPPLVWAGIALIAVALALLPFGAGLVGQAWVRILNLR
jgi:branched-chain amino acid transport system permease protein